MAALTPHQSHSFPPGSQAPKSFLSVLRLPYCPALSSEAIQLTPMVAVTIADQGEAEKVPGTLGGKVPSHFPSVLFLFPHIPLLPSPPPTWLRLTGSRAPGVQVLFFSWWGKGGGD